MVDRKVDGGGGNEWTVKYQKIVTLRDRVKESYKRRTEG